MAIYDDPAAFGVAVDISSTDHTLPANSRAIFCGGAGNLKVDLVGGSTITLTGVVAGSTLALRATKVYKTGTTCTNMTALW